MKRMLLLAAALLFSINIYAQYPEVSIMDIQYQNPANLVNYFTDDMASPLNGDTVTVTGVVMVPPNKSANPDSGVLMYVGGGAQGFYMQDTSATDWAGVLVRYANIPSGSDFSTLDSGLVIKITGVVNEYATTTQKTTQFDIFEFSAGNNIIGMRPRPQPVVLTLDSLKETGTNNNKAIAEKWEGVYVEIRNVTTFDRQGNGSFKVIDANGTQLSIGTKSNYYYQNQAPLDGTYLAYVRGYIETRSASSGGVTLNPGFKNDIKILSFPPSISTIQRNPGVVGYNQNVNVTAEITDLDGSITSAKLVYKINGGADQEADMSNVGGVTWQGTIPGQADSALISYYVKAVDNQNNVSLAPADTSKGRYFYMTLNRPLTIKDVQYSPFGSGFSAYNSYQVTVTGIVTADTSDLTPMVYMQQEGGGEWSGIKLKGTRAILLKRGDKVTVTGTVAEDFSVTEIRGLDNVSNVTVLSSNNPLPAPEVLSTNDIGAAFSGEVYAEKWEGVMVKFNNLTVTDNNADGYSGPDLGSGNNRNFGEIYVADNSNVNFRVELQDGNHDYHNGWADYLFTLPNNVYVDSLDTFQSITGILYFSHSFYKLLPRKNNDFTGFSTDVNEENLLNDFSLEQNYPNPFNPATVISYSLPKEENVTLKIYNSLGQEVKTLVNSVQSPGAYKVSFNAGDLSSGVYFYSLKAGSFLSIKKMMLIK